ncbi:nocturnin [Patella vulgata]|uniref:nocturnin n=1 Tax=Patella vulgata TaxID=6465 RepID=UPI0024A9A66B|nr:nocturnin [Patella vulgata]
MSNQYEKRYQNERSEKNLPPLFKRQLFNVDLSRNCVSSSSEIEQPSFRIMQWNLLAQALSKGGDNFVLCPPEALVWDIRKLHIMEEILTPDPTIVCLQEVDHFKYIETELGKAGYKGTFFPKPFSPCLDITPNYGPDGCAIFWKSDAVDVINIKSVIIKEPTGYETNQVCIVIHMKLKQSNNRELFVAATHLKAKKGYDQVRHLQSKFIDKLLKEMCGDSPVILCGDFNADPSEKAYKELMSSDLELSSAYTFLSENLEEPPFTTNKVRGSPLGPVAYCRTIDFVLFSKNKLAVSSILKFPTEEEIGEKRLPSFNYPSDHLSLVCDFQFKK